MKKYVISINPNGEVFEERVLEGADMLSVLQRLCGGYIEIVETGIANDLVMAVNEEGKIKGLPVNFFSTRILSDRYNDVLCGTAVLLLREGEELLPIPEYEAQYCAMGLRRAFKEE